MNPAISKFYESSFTKNYLRNFFVFICIQQTYYKRATHLLKSSLQLITDFLSDRIPESLASHAKTCLTLILSHFHPPYVFPTYNLKIHINFTFPPTLSSYRFPKFCKNFLSPQFKLHIRFPSYY